MCVPNRVILHKRLSSSDVREHLMELIATDAGSPPLSSRATLRIDARALLCTRAAVALRTRRRRRRQSLAGRRRTAVPFATAEAERKWQYGGGNEREGLVLLEVLGVLVALMSLLIAAVLFVLCRSRRKQVDARASRYQQKQQPEVAGAFTLLNAYCRMLK